VVRLVRQRAEVRARKGPADEPVAERVRHGRELRDLPSVALAIAESDAAAGQRDLRRSPRCGVATSGCVSSGFAFIVPSFVMVLGFAAAHVEG
jgi:hypothetical protein